MKDGAAAREIIDALPQIERKCGYDVCVNCGAWTKVSRRGQCESCYRRWYRSQPRVKEKHAAYMRRARKERPGVYRAIDRKRQQTDGRKRWRSKYNREYYQKHAEEMREYARDWRKNNPEKMRCHDNARRARKNAAPGMTSFKQWMAILEHYCRDGKCIGCIESLDSSDPLKKVTMDHVVPLSTGGTHWPDNIQPLCHSCNCSKNDIELDFRYDMGEFCKGLMNESIDDSTH